MKLKLFAYNFVYFIIILLISELVFYFLYLAHSMGNFTLDEVVKYAFTYAFSIRIFYHFWSIGNDKIHLFGAGFVYNLVFYLLALAFKLPNYEPMIMALNFIFISSFWNCIKNKSYMVTANAIITEKQIQEFDDKAKDDEFYDI